MLEGDHFVDDHARAEEITHLRAIAPGNADDPGYRRKNPSENLREACREPGNPVVNSAHDSVYEVEQRNKRDKHSADIESEVQTIDCPARNSAKKMSLVFYFGHFDPACRKRLL